MNREAVIVATGRSAIGRAGKGGLAHTRPDDFGAQVLAGVVGRAEGLAPGDIEDVVVGCAMPEAEQGFNMGRVLALGAGLGDTVPGQTVNRLCASGLQALAIATAGIQMGSSDVVVAGGVESMSMVPIGGFNYLPDPVLTREQPGSFLSMGLTAERVADKYGISRQQQDELAARSHERAAAAIDNGWFDRDIVPVRARSTRVENGRLAVQETSFAQDDGVRRGTTVEKLGTLRPVFREGGSVTAGNSSQMSDGAAFLVVMERERAEQLDLKPLARLTHFAVTGVDPALMGIGPMFAIPKLLKQAGLSVDDIDLFELNEAFAAQAVACIDELRLPLDKVNVNGGAIALGHPLGCTGALLSVRMISELARRGAKRGVVSMCVGGGMGAAGLLELIAD